MASTESGSASSRRSGNRNDATTTTDSGAAAPDPQSQRRNHGNSEAAGDKSPAGALTDAASSASEAGTEEPDPTDYARELQLEVEVEADRIRRAHPELVRKEREIELAWAALAPVSGPGDEHEDLLVRAERFAHTDVDAPFGAKAAIRRVKQTIRKLTYWYLRYLADQINVWNNIVVRWMRRTERRIEALEAATSASPWPVDDHLTAESVHRIAREVVNAIQKESPSPARSGAPSAAGNLRQSANRESRAPTLMAVLGCAEAGLVAELETAGVAAYGLSPHIDPHDEGHDQGLDLRRAEVLDHLITIPEGSLGGVVLCGTATTVPVQVVPAVVQRSLRVVAAGGVVAVAAADPELLEAPERDLRRGAGAHPDTWAYLLRRANCDVQQVDVGGTGPVTTLALARRR